MQLVPIVLFSRVVTVLTVATSDVVVVAFRVNRFGWAIRLG